ncbi:hypothetical protein [Mesorhizobium sp.]|uniref:hypothetical protein n=1 Tax=Mesorhizobium sp. TaxID=1871066 RepID=UPI0025CD97D2|nr:hypothetical protein [Mesorhizobium sp.]
MRLDPDQLALASSPAIIFLQINCAKGNARRIGLSSKPSGMRACHSACLQVFFARL